MEFKKFIKGHKRNAQTSSHAFSFVASLQICQSQLVSLYEIYNSFNIVFIVQLKWVLSSALNSKMTVVQSWALFSPWYFI